MVIRTGSSSFAVLALAAVAAAASLSVLAQEPAGPGEEDGLSQITVTATRQNPKPMVSTTGWPRAAVTQVTLSYAVTVAGYDLTTKSGVADLEKAVKETARDVCKQIGRQYPGSTPDDAECAKAATDAAMVQVHRLVAAAQGSGSE